MPTLLAVVAEPVIEPRHDAVVKVGGDAAEDGEVGRGGDILQDHVEDLVAERLEGAIAWSSSVGIGFLDDIHLCG